MKKEQLIQKLMKKNKPTKRKEFNHERKTSNLKIIGITGSRGKSSTAYMVHKYLLQRGYKSILYSSVEIDSPISYKAKVSMENPMYDERMVLDALLEAEDYQADYLILEVNERAISKGLTEDIPFDIRVLTTIIPGQNNLYENYVGLKEKFMLEDDNAILITSVDCQECINLSQKLKAKKVVTFTSEYLKNFRSVKENVDYLFDRIDDDFDSINGLRFKIIHRGKEENIETSLLMPFNAMNITCCVSILDTLKVYDYLSFKEFIRNFEIPGRDEIIKYQGRTIIVSLNLMPHLEILSTYKKGNLIVVTGAYGDGYVDWVKEFDDDEYSSKRQKDIIFTYNYIKKYADYLYVTTTDMGSTDVNQMLDYQMSLFNNMAKSEKVVDRYEAIKKAIINSKVNDIILISGRGNRRILCYSKDKAKIFIDREAIRKIIEDRGD